MNARREWLPEFAHAYGIKPWEMHRVTLRELRLMGEHFDRMRQEAERG